MASNKSEFAGGPGLIQPEQRASMTDQQELWTVYASDPDSPAAPDPSRVGQPGAYKNTSRAPEPTIPDLPA